MVLNIRYRLLVNSTQCVYLSAMYLSAMYLSAMFLSAMYLSAMYLSAMYLSALYLSATYLSAMPSAVVSTALVYLFLCAVYNVKKLSLRVLSFTFFLPFVHCEHRVRTYTISVRRLQIKLIEKIFTNILVSSFLYAL